MSRRLPDGTRIVSRAITVHRVDDLPGVFIDWPTGVRSWEPTREDAERRINAQAVAICRRWNAIVCNIVTWIGMGVGL